MGDQRRAQRPDLLAISDLHLGFDLRRGTVPAAAPPQDAPLVALLNHYEPLAGPGGWRLVIAGDMIDFIGITLTPSPDERVPFSTTPDELRSGLAPEPDKTVWKLHRVFKRHEHFLRRLALFVARGHRLSIIRGNHDQEWTFPTVQTAFVRALWGLAGHTCDLGGFERRIRFHDWFYLEPGRLFIEHGHLHDEFSATFDAGHASWRRRLDEPVSSLALRWFGNRHDGLDMNAVDRWGFADYIRWAVNGRRFWRAWSDYIVMSAKLVARSTSGGLRSIGRALPRRGNRSHRRDRLRTILTAVRDEHEHVIHQLAALWRHPADESLLLVAQMLYLDRFVLGAITAAAIGVGATCIPHAHWRLGLIATLVTGAAATNRFLATSRQVESHPKLLEVARRIADRLAVPIVVMGHSHHAVDVRFPSGARYFNLGTWLPHAAPEETSGFRHLVIDAGGERLECWPSADRFRSRSGRSIPTGPNSGATR